MSVSLPVVIIGAGPVGLAAAAHVLSRGLAPVVLEAGPAVGAGVSRWAHVRMFSAWEYDIDRRAAELLATEGWEPPDPAHFPTGREIVEHYLKPLAATRALSDRIRVDARVTGVTRRHRDRLKNAQRDVAPFVVRYVERGEERELLAQAVIDASGTIGTPNPIGASGIPALGERAAHAHVYYGIPDALGVDRARYAGKRVLVVGSGHSAFNVLTDLARLARDDAATSIHWALRRPTLHRVFGGGEKDRWQERGRLGQQISRLVDDGAIGVHTGAHIDRIERTANGWTAWCDGSALPEVDEIVATTGFRPDLSMLDELRLALDPVTQSPVALAPLIDPNFHSCGTVPPHGAIELKHPEPGFYVAGMKSFGRAPTFLLLAGYEQVRSIAAAIAGDWEAASRVELVLPETGVCVTDVDDDEVESTIARCCDSSQPVGIDATPTAASIAVAALRTRESSCCGTARA